jgi:hypothetical protein
MKRERLKASYFSDGSDFVLKFGNYMINGYLIFYSSDERIWRIDG